MNHELFFENLIKLTFTFQLFFDSSSWIKIVYDDYNMDSLD